MKLKDRVSSFPKNFPIFQSTAAVVPKVLILFKPSPLKLWVNDVPPVSLNESGEGVIGKNKLRAGGFGPNAGVLVPFFLDAEIRVER